MTGVVLDTNVLVSANLNDQGLEAFVVSLCLNGRLTLYISAAILTEYERALNDPRLKFRPAATAAFLQRMRRTATVVSPAFVVNKAERLITASWNAPRLPARSSW